MPLVRLVSWCLSPVALAARSTSLRDWFHPSLAAEGLVELDGRNVSAVPLAAFIQALQAREEFAEPKYLWPV